MIQSSQVETNSSVTEAAESLVDQESPKREGTLTASEGEADAHYIGAISKPTAKNIGVSCLCLAVLTMVFLVVGQFEIKPTISSIVHT